MSATVKISTSRPELGGTPFRVDASLSPEKPPPRLHGVGAVEEGPFLGFSGQECGLALFADMFLSRLPGNNTQFPSVAACNWASTAIADIMTLCDLNIGSYPEVLLHSLPKSVPVLRFLASQRPFSRKA